MEIFIPIGTGSQDNWELRFHLRSLEKHLKSQFKATILGEQGVSIPWLNNAFYVDVTRFYPDFLEEKNNGIRYMENFYCTLAKYKWLVSQDWCPETFVIAYDDQLLVKDICDFGSFEALALCRETKIPRRPTRHERTIIKAIELAKTRKPTSYVYNYETHGYRVIERDKMRMMFNLFPFECLDVPYAPFTLYNNLFFERPNKILNDTEEDIISYLHFDSDGRHHYIATRPIEMDEIAESSTMLSYNDLGLKACSQLVKHWIETRFPDKSKFEK